MCEDSIDNYAHISLWVRCYLHSSNVMCFYLLYVSDQLECLYCIELS